MSPSRCTCVAYCAVSLYFHGSACVKMPCSGRAITHSRLPQRSRFICSKREGGGGGGSACRAHARARARARPTSDCARSSSPPHKALEVPLLWLPRGGPKVLCAPPLGIEEHGVVRPAERCAGRGSSSAREREASQVWAHVQTTHDAGAASPVAVHGRCAEEGHTCARGALLEDARVVQVRRLRAAWRCVRACTVHA
jgi:hypothetical protein